MICAGGIDESASHRKQPGADGVEQAVADVRALAAVRQARHADARLACRRRADDGRGVVG